MDKLSKLLVESIVLNKLYVRIQALELSRANDKKRPKKGSERREKKKINNRKRGPLRVLLLVD